MRYIRQGIYIVILLVCLCFCADIQVQAAKAWDGESTQVYAGGNGSAESPYKIANAKQLAYLAKMVNAGEPYVDTYFVLTADIDLNKKSWTGIGTAMTEFQGHLDGQGHVISNLYIKKKTKAKGLFAYTVDAEICNITMTGVNIQGKNYVGALVGIASNTIIRSCSVSGEISGQKYVGGLVGYEADALSSDGTPLKLISSCINKAKITGTRYVGGIAGYYKGCVYSGKNYGDVFGTQTAGGIIGYGSANSCINHGTLCGVQDIGGITGYAIKNIDVTGCANLGTVNASIETGGVAGYVPNDTLIMKCSNYGQVSGTERVGGVAGVGSFSQSFNMGTVVGAQYVGGLSGYTFGGESGYSYNRGKVNGGTEGTYIGGVVGYMQSVSGGNTLSYCYSTGKITGKKNVGGVVGYNGGTVSDTFYRVNQASTGIGSGNKGTARPKEAADMKASGMLKLLNADETLFKQKSGCYPTLINAKAATSSNLSTAKAVSRVSSFTAKAGKKKVTLTWEPVQRATGYEIYRYNKTKKKYVKVKTLPTITLNNGSADFVSTCILSGLKSGTTYRFKIRVYKEVSGKKYYGAYRKVSVKVK